LRIIIDAMGGDKAPESIVKGAAQASLVINHEIRLVGDEAIIKEILETVPYNADNISVLHAPDVITGEDSPVKAIRRKTESSMVKGLEEVRDGRGDLFMSAGNSGALMAGSIFILGRLDGIDRPAIASTYPMLETGKAALLIDSGANAEVKPQNLLQFAVMGTIYAKEVLGIEKPRTGLVNMGTEPGKGPAIIKEAYELLEESKKEGLLPGFIGNIEARDVPIGIADVVVCDGYVGNVILKTTEGVALSVLHLLRNKFTEGTVAKLGAGLLAGKLREMKKAFDYTEYGGAPVLGVKGGVIKMHGSSDEKAVQKSIARALPFMEHDVVGIIKKALLSH
jgi:glycerol-3-phosphate acyltransferase PlsX